MMAESLGACLTVLELFLRRLVGVAWVQPSGSTALDKFLRLPADTLAVMRCRFIFPKELPVSRL